MGYTPIRVGEQLTYQFSWVYDTGQPFALPPGTTLTMRFAPQVGSWPDQSAFTGDGTWVIVDNDGGLANYTLGTQDVATAGRWNMQGSALVPGAPSPRYSDPLPLEIEAAL